MINLPRSKLWLGCWWLIWALIYAQQWSVHTWHGPWFADNPAFSRPVFVIMLLPLLASVALRWLVLPRMTTTGATFAVFFTGMLLAAFSAFFANFMDLPFKQAIYLVCIISIVEFAPLRFGGSKMPNHPTEPSSPSGTSAAGHPPRQP